MSNPSHNAFRIIIEPVNGTAEANRGLNIGTGDWTGIPVGEERFVINPADLNGQASDKAINCIKGVIALFQDNQDLTTALAQITGQCNGAGI